MERLVRTGLLYDFYGGLLTDKQRKVMELYYNEDWSLAEIATKEAVSRQAVHDLLQRSERLMEEYEAKLGLVKLFTKQQTILMDIAQKLGKIIEECEPNSPKTKLLYEIKEQIEQLIELETLEEGEIKDGI
ncbi:MAG TPA: putative DNA-binding protein [Bacillota bacterium]|nr:putative DNA-binding protein [Bacillota bacterium]HOL10076.1 putative DNA-binding protein [Bacillota bacterium]HPO98748.1 putative DNA-binding protein [Bacillota bacterium]